MTLRDGRHSVNALCHAILRAEFEYLLKVMRDETASWTFCPSMRLAKHHMRSYHQLILRHDFDLRFRGRPIVTIHKILAVCSLAAWISTPASAESLMHDFYTSLGPADAYNSRAQPLDNICAILQQDRANWHKFGKREQFDGGDFFFTTPARRALITQTCQYDASYYAQPGERIRSGVRNFYVYVRVFGSGGAVTRVLISEGAG
ncbi:MAG: hypothetical protein HRU30_15230 [Rhodobacteraceae bacterium]|nr:hypothetical protein [Paracoccaceae bacterium]